MPRISIDDSLVLQSGSNTCHAPIQPKLHKQGLSKLPLNKTFLGSLEKHNVVNLEHWRNHSAVVYSTPAPLWVFVTHV